MSTLLHDLGIWPLDLHIVLAAMTGILLANALRGWRDLVTWIGFAAVLMWPLKWTGTALGSSDFSQAILASPFAPNGDFQFPVRPTAAVLGALFLSALAIAVWKKFTRTSPREAEVSEQEWTSLRNFGQAVLVILTPFLHLWTVFIVPAGGAEGLVATLLLPGFAQIYWIAALWPKTATLSHPLTLGSVVWVCAFITWLTANWMIGNRRASAAAAGQTIAPRIRFPARPVIKRDAC
jgi:hypothetical protein